MADADAATAQHSIEWGGEGVFTHPFFGKVERGDSPLVGGLGLIVLLLRNRPIFQEGIRALEGFFGIIVIRLRFGHGGGLLRLIDLQEEIPFFDRVAFNHLNGGNFPVHFGTNIDRFICLERSDGLKGLWQGTNGNGDELGRHGGILGGSSSLHTTR